MANSEKIEKETKPKSKETLGLGSIEPVKIGSIAEKTLAPENASNSTDSDSEAESRAVLEQSLMTITRIFLREHGIRKSGAAIRDAVEAPHETFAPKQAVSALSVLGFKASFGNIKLKKLKSDFFPLIAFLQNGDAILLKSLTTENDVISATNLMKKQVARLREMSPLWEMHQEGIDLDTIEWATH